MGKNIQRNSNLEILRILAMFFIIAHHFAVHTFSGVTFTSNFDAWFIYFLSDFGKIGVDVFILISSYFMINSKFTFKKLLTLGGGVYFYSITIFILFLTVVTPVTPINTSNIVISLLPISHSAYWFITDYIVLMLLSPFLNKFIKRVGKDDLMKLIILILIMWSIYPTVTGDSFGINSLVWFIALYLIGSFIRLYININKIRENSLILIFSSSIIITLMLVGISLSISGLNQSSLFQFDQSIFNREYSLFILTASVSLFLIFLKREEFSNKYINYISGSVIGVYLIHSNVFLSPYIWKFIIPTLYYRFNPNLVLFAIISTVSIYLICTGIDIIRRLSVERLWIWIIDNKLNNVPKVIDNNLNNILKWFDNNFADKN